MQDIITFKYFGVIIKRPASLINAYERYLQALTNWGHELNRCERYHAPSRTLCTDPDCPYCPAVRKAKIELEDAKRNFEHEVTQYSVS